MINNSNDFATTYSDLLSKHNYKGLVGLLSSTEFKDDATRKTANDLKRRFQEQADIEDKLLEGTDDNTRRAYNFITTGPSATEISTDENNPLYNSFSSRFMRNWNALADKDNNINIKFYNEDDYNNFISSLGKDENDARKKGININSNYSISFASDINDKIGVYNALKNSGILEHLKTEIYNTGYNEPGIIKSKGSAKNLSEDKRKLYLNMTEMESTVNEANALYTELFEAKAFKPYINEMIVTGYMGEDDRQLQQSFSAGLIDLASFKEMRTILEEKYNRVLQTKSLSQFDVWAMNEDNEGSQVLKQLDDPIMKNELDIEINQAIADGRLHYSHATNGTDIGTMIVIDPAVKDGKIVEDSKPRRLFVKDLFRSQAETALRNDTQTAAQMEYAKHQTYGHIYRTSDGGTINGWTGQSDSAIYKNKFGVEQIMGKADILDVIDNDIIAKRMIDYYDLATEVDANGNGYTQEYFKVFGNEGWNATKFYNNVATKCTAAMANKYKGQSEEFIRYKANELISTILRNLNNVHKQESKDTFSELYMENSGNVLY